MQMHHCVMMLLFKLKILKTENFLCLFKLNMVPAVVPENTLEPLKQIK